MTRIASVNVNGIRAAARKGMGEWIDASGVDILTLQEVRGQREHLE
ncbi:MAG: exodeoxyribonuclease III, partial [Cellulosimicrobium funkei]